MNRRSFMKAAIGGGLMLAVPDKRFWQLDRTMITPKPQWMGVGIIGAAEVEPLELSDQWVFNYEHDLDGQFGLKTIQYIVYDVPNPDYYMDEYAKKAEKEGNMRLIRVEDRGKMSTGDAYTLIFRSNIEAEGVK